MTIHVFRSIADPGIICFAASETAEILRLSLRLGSCWAPTKPIAQMATICWRGSWNARVTTCFGRNSLG